VPDFRGNHTKSSRTCGSFGGDKHRSGCGKQDEKLGPEYGPVGCSEDMVVIL